jgi:hypothetical protein
MKRAPFMALGVVAVLVLAPGQAGAKMPPYSVEATPSEPTAGETVRLTVRFWNDAQQTERATWWDVPALPNFLWAHPVGDASGAIPIDIAVVRPGVYRGEAKLSSPGHWVLCSWSRRCERGSSMAGDPGRIELTVAPEPAPQAGQGGVGEPPPDTSSRFPLSPIVVAALVVSAAALVVRSARLRRT